MFLLASRAYFCWIVGHHPPDGRLRVREDGDRSNRVVLGGRHPTLMMPVLSTVQRRNLVVICGGLTGTMATSWYFLSRRGDRRKS